MNSSIFLDSSSVITIPEHLQESDSKTVHIGANESDRRDSIHVESAAQARDLAAALLKVAESLDGIESGIITLSDPRARLNMEARAASMFAALAKLQCPSCNHVKANCDRFRASNPSEWARTHGRVIA